MLHNTPFGDIVDTEDDLQPYLWRATDAADGIFRLLSVVIGTAGGERGGAAAEGQSKDTPRSRSSRTRWCRERSLPFRRAHAVTIGVVKLATSEGRRGRRHLARARRPGGAGAWSGRASISSADAGLPGPGSRALRRDADGHRRSGAEEIERALGGAPRRPRRGDIPTPRARREGAGPAAGAGRDGHVGASGLRPFVTNLDRIRDAPATS